MLFLPVSRVPFAVETDPFLRGDPGHKFRDQIKRNFVRFFEPDAAFTNVELL